MNLNKVSLIGNLATQPLPSGTLPVRFRLAINHFWCDAETKERREKVEFHTVVAWGKLAETVWQYVRKGSKVYVEGRLATRQWQDKGGQKRRTTEVVADMLIMLGARRAPVAQ